MPWLQIFAYFKNYNYTVKSTGEVIVFVGKYQASKGQAAALVLYTFVGEWTLRQVLHFQPLLVCGCLKSAFCGLYLKLCPGLPGWRRNAFRTSVQRQGYLVKVDNLICCTQALRALRWC